MVAAEDSPGVHYDYGIIHRQGGTTAAAEADVLVTSAPISERQSPRASCSCLRSATASARVLQAAHIRPLPEGGEQRLDNGLLRAPAHCATQLGIVSGAVAGARPSALGAGDPSVPVLGCIRAVERPWA